MPSLDNVKNEQWYHAVVVVVRVLVGVVVSQQQQDEDAWIVVVSHARLPCNEDRRSDGYGVEDGRRYA